MKCAECGAEDCEERYHALLAAEWGHPETAAMHGLFILVYHVQHPSLCKPWIRAAQRDSLREIFAENRDWRAVVAAPKDRRLRQENVAQAKRRFANAPESQATGHPIEGEMTVADIGVPGSPEYLREYPDRVEAWARSVAKHRLL